MENSTLILYNNTADNNVCNIIEEKCVPSKYKLCDAEVIENKLITSKNGETLGTSLILKVKKDTLFSTFNAYRGKFNNTDFDEFIENIRKNVEVYIRQSYVAAVRIDNVA